MLASRSVLVWRVTARNRAKARNYEMTQRTTRGLPTIQSVWMAFEDQFTLDKLHKSIYSDPRVSGECLRSSVSSGASRHIQFQQLLTLASFGTSSFLSLVWLLPSVVSLPGVIRGVFLVPTRYNSLREFEAFFFSSLSVNEGNFRFEIHRIVRM